MKFCSDRNFKIWAYTVSHSSLLVRSIIKYPDEDDYSENTSYNIDIEFWAVEYMDVPVSMKEIALNLITNNNLPAKVKYFSNINNSKVFEIETNKNKYYVIAGGCLVGINKWHQEDRIFNNNLNLKHDEIIIAT